MDLDSPTESLADIATMKNSTRLCCYATPATISLTTKATRKCLEL